ncbi:MAG: hypothetical protein V4497_10935 [Bacteroidota bacterium]
MITQNQAQIYLATARGTQQTQGYNCWSTFNFGNYQEKSKRAFGSLFLFNYQILGAKQSRKIEIQANSLNYILPLYGGIKLKDEQQNEHLIVTEQIQQIISNKESNFEISNSFDQNVSFLQIGFYSETSLFSNESLEFDFDKKNKLIPLFENDTAAAFIANFDGRKETHYQLKNAQNGIFVFVIQGAFEFENRLLETGDALSLKEIESAEWEALSQNAMILLIEIPFL